MREVGQDLMEVDIPTFDVTSIQDQRITLIICRIRYRGSAMSRVIRSQSAARIRRKLLQSLAHAIAADHEGELSKSERRDVLAFVVQILEEIASSVSATTGAWEKRGYWVKADRFMMEWSWVTALREPLARALEQSEMPSHNVLYRELIRHVSGVETPVRTQQTKPWAGAWSQRKAQAI